MTALVWATLAQSFWRSRGTARPRGTLMWLVRIRPPGRVWLALNYGLGVMALAVAWLLWPVHGSPPVIVVQVFLPLMTALILCDAGRLARRRWRPVFMANLRFGGFLALAVVLFAGVLATILTEPREHAHSLASSASRTFLALALAAPFALRNLGEVVRRFLVTAVKLTAAIGIYLGARAAVERWRAPAWDCSETGAPCFPWWWSSAPADPGCARGSTGWCFAKATAGESGFEATTTRSSRRMPAPRRERSKPSGRAPRRDGGTGRGRSGVWNPPGKLAPRRLRAAAKQDRIWR